MKIYDRYEGLDFRNLEFSYKKNQAQPVQQPLVAPTAPVEEASVEIDDDDIESRARTSKSSLKMPLATASDTGLRI